MGEVFFYHLTRQALEPTLRVILEKSLAQGWRVAVRAPDDSLLDRLDQQLWLIPEDGFLPHGRAGGPQDADQPILLTPDRTAANRPDAVVSVAGAEIGAHEAATLARASILFDGQDAAAVEAARAQWRRLTEAGIGAVYWSDASGRWEEKSRSPARAT
ncbi:MAG: DNA polymerase III subunit chi [Pseudomonadota bacterium]